MLDGEMEYPQDDLDFQCYEQQSRQGTNTWFNRNGNNHRERQVFRAIGQQQDRERAHSNAAARK
jgi:hypothetical protein